MISNLYKLAALTGLAIILSACGPGPTRETALSATPPAGAGLSPSATRPPYPPGREPAAETPPPYPAPTGETGEPDLSATPPPYLPPVQPTLRPSPSAAPTRPTGTLPLLSLTPRLPPTPWPSVFPTPAFPAAAPAPAVSRLIYPFFPGPAAQPLLHILQLDASAGRQGLLGPPLNLDLDPTWPGSRLWRLSAAPGGQTILAEILSGDSAQPYLISQLVSGPIQVRPVLPEAYSLSFLGWGPQAKSALFLPPLGPAKPLSVDLQSGKSTPIPLPGDGSDYPPGVNGLVFAPDGSLLADALIYYPVEKQRQQGYLEIGLRSGLAGARRGLCTLAEGTILGAHGLAFSPDGSRLAWVTSTLEPGTPGPPLTGQQAQLWLADLASGKCRSLVLLARDVNYAHPPAWSADGRWIAAVSARRGADGLAYEDGILLVDPVSGQAEALPVGRAAASVEATLPPQNLGDPPDPNAPAGMSYRSWGVSNLAWSPDGRFLAFTFSDGTAAEIRAIELASRRSFALAGPVPPLAPFVWINK